MENKYCERCGKKLGTEVTDIHTCTPKRDFKFSIIDEAMQSIPTPKMQLQLTDDEERFADAFIILQKAGYGKEAEIVLRCKSTWKGLTNEDINYIEEEYITSKGIIRATELKLKEKNNG